MSPVPTNLRLAEVLGVRIVTITRVSQFDIHLSVCYKDMRYQDKHAYWDTFWR